MIESKSVNPLIEMTSDPPNGRPLLELKKHLVMFLDKPPSPKQAALVYELYRDQFGERIKKYRSTTPGCLPVDWNSHRRKNFETNELPNLRQRVDWGYWFWDGAYIDSWHFAFHGSRPASQPGWASFYRFEFDYSLEDAVLFNLAEALISLVPFSSGYAGYAFYGRPSSNYERRSYNSMFHKARRYWGVEAQDIDVTIQYALKGYKCVNWLTMIGKPFYPDFRRELMEAKSVAYKSEESSHGILLQSAEYPLLGDRNRKQDLGGYIKIANALLPLQMTSHGSFGGDLWTDENTLAWLRRFTHPNDVY